MKLAPIVVSITALGFSIVSFLIGFRSARAVERRGRMPVLVFQYDGQRGWVLRNVGNGPALNVVVAKKHVQGPDRDTWFDAVRVPPLGRDSELLLKWLGHQGDFGLGALYDDFVADEEGGRSYTSTCGNDLTQIHAGHTFGPFRESDITASWKL